MLAPKKKSVVQGVMNGEVQDVTRARPDDLLPEFDQLNNLLGLNAGAPVADILGEILLGPLRELTSNRGKGIRRRLVALSCRLINESGDRSLVAAKQCKACAEVVELIHTGSLVVDDIEDGSSTRRGRPALHVRYGLPLELNAGNWLYFWPFE